MSSIYQQWLDAKTAEKKAVEERRMLEDVLIAQFNINAAQDKANTVKQGGYKINITTRLTQKIDSDLLQEIAAEHGTSEHLSSLFNWTPKLVKKEWNATDESITAPLLKAFTTKAARPTFKITKEI